MMLTLSEPEKAKVNADRVRMMGSHGVRVDCRIIAVDTDRYRSSWDRMALIEADGKFHVVPIEDLST